MTTAKMACGNPSEAIPRTNCGPTPYPTANRNMMKKIDLTLGETTMPSWPIRIATSKVPVTVPRLKLPSLMTPIQ